MSVMKEYDGRTFSDREYFQPLDRIPAGLSRNRVWLYTVERGNELDRNTGQQSDRIIVRIVRWQARIESDGQKSWRYRSSYNVRSSEEWENTSYLVDNFIEGSIQADSFIPISVKEIERLNAGLFKQKSEKRKLYAMIRDLKNIGSVREAELRLHKHRLSIMRSNVKEMESILSDYKKLISQSYTTETEVHGFLVEHKAFWMFGLEYIGIKSKVNFPPRKNYYEFDLMLQRYDNFWDLVELKGPNENLFDKRTKRRNKPNEKLSEAIGQVFAYLYSIDKVWDENIVKPKAYIVIGKEETDRPYERRVFSSYLSNVELITYFELHERGRLLLNHIKHIKD